MSRRRPSRALISGLVGVLTQEALLRATAASPRWERQNYRGKTVNLSGGVGAAAGALSAAVMAPAGARAAACTVVAVSTAAGAADDFVVDPGAAKGLAGHIRALLQGEVTTGGLKLIGISGAALVAGASIAARRGRGGVPRVMDALSTGALIAGSANLINLFDLRPGRALKVCGLWAAGLACSRHNPLGAAIGTNALGVIAGATPRDLAETTMLGDVGANALGALLGLGAAHHPNWTIRSAALAGVVGLILMSEKVSFSAIIENNPALARADSLGRAA